MTGTYSPILDKANHVPSPVIQKDDLRKTVETLPYGFLLRWHRTVKLCKYINKFRFGTDNCSKPGSLLYSGTVSLSGDGERRWRGDAGEDKGTGRQGSDVLTCA